MTVPCFTSYAFRTRKNHFFVEIDGAFWLLDTGAPSSFGSTDTLELSGQTFTLARDFMGMNATQLSQYVGVDCSGLLGADIWGNFDLVLDQPGEIIQITNDAAVADGPWVTLTDLMGIPLIEVTIGHESLNLFLDTGASIAYLNMTVLSQHPVSRSTNDFYPGYGPFETLVYRLPITIGLEDHTIDAGSLPEALSVALMHPSVDGILSNAVFMDRVVVFSPRRHQIAFGPRRPGS